MRILALFLLLAGCSPEAPEPPTERLLYAGEGRDRLCIAGNRGGFIIYGEGNANCSARGRIEQSAGRLVLTPDGDADCRIEAKLSGDRLAVGTRSAACAFYCGPGADYSGKGLAMNASATRRS